MVHVYIIFLVSNPPNDRDIHKVARKLAATLEDDDAWEEFGLNLLDATSKEDLVLIKQKANGTLKSKCTKLLQHWKAHAPKSKRRWEQVVDSLHDLGYEELAEELAEALSGTDTHSQGKPQNCHTKRCGYFPIPK